MKLNLQKPLVIFDLETTGLDLVKDRVIQLSYIKVFPDGKEVRGDELINPEKTIPEVVIQLTGITNEDVKDKPTFKQLASKLNEVFMGSDIAGYNSNNFDVRVASSTPAPSSEKWSAEIWLLPISSIVDERWRKTSRPIVLTRIRRLPIAC